MKGGPPGCRPPPLAAASQTMPEQQPDAQDRAVKLKPLARGGAPHRTDASGQSGEWCASPSLLLGQAP